MWNSPSLANSAISCGKPSPTAHPQWPFRWTGHQGTRTSTWSTPLALCGVS